MHALARKTNKDISDCQKLLSDIDSDDGKQVSLMCSSTIEKYSLHRVLSRFILLYHDIILLWKSLHIIIYDTRNFFEKVKKSPAVISASNVVF